MIENILNSLLSAQSQLDDVVRGVRRMSDAESIEAAIQRNAHEKRISSLEKRISFLESIFDELGITPDTLSVTEVAEIRKAVISALIPF